MALQKRVSELPAVSTVAATDQLIVSSANATKRCTVQQIGAYFQANGVAGPAGPAGPTGPAGAGGVTSLQGLTGGLTLAAVGGTWAASGSTITLTVTAASADWSAITGKPATFPPAGHTHDDRYYTETEVDSLLAGKQASGSYAAATHTHNSSAISDFSTAAVAAVTWSTLTGKPTFSAVATSGAYADLSGTPAAYSLPTATASVLGGVKIGSGVTIADGVISVSTNYAAASHTHGISDVTGLQTALDGKQAAGSYAASVHGHSISDVTGLQTALDGKSSVSHTHSASDVTSGTLSIDRIPTGQTSTTVPLGNDSRFTDARTPTDGSVTDAKIAAAGLSTSSLNWAAIQPWAANTAYAKGDLVSNAGIAYRRSAAGTSGATFNVANWQQITPSEFVASQIGSGTIATARLGSGTASASNFLRGDGSWAAAGSKSASDLTSGTLSEARLDHVPLHPFLLMGG